MEKLRRCPSEEGVFDFKGKQRASWKEDSGVERNVRERRFCAMWRRVRARRCAGGRCCQQKKSFICLVSTSWSKMGAKNWMAC